MLLENPSMEKQIEALEERFNQKLVSFMEKPLQQLVARMEAVEQRRPQQAAQSEQVVNSNLNASLDAVADCVARVDDLEYRLDEVQSSLKGIAEVVVSGFTQVDNIATQQMEMVKAMEDSMLSHSVEMEQRLQTLTIANTVPDVAAQADDLEDRLDLVGGSLQSISEVVISGFTQVGILAEKQANLRKAVEDSILTYRAELDKRLQKFHGKDFLVPPSQHNTLSADMTTCEQQLLAMTADVKQLQKDCVNYHARIQDHEVRLSMYCCRLDTQKDRQQVLTDRVAILAQGLEELLIS